MIHLWIPPPLTKATWFSASRHEYSFVLEGELGALLGDEVLTRKPGDLIFKPRNQWHTFWNAGDRPARILEIISPAGFEKFFRELIDLGGVTKGRATGLRRGLPPLRAGGESRECTGAHRAFWVAFSE